MNWKPNLLPIVAILCGIALTGCGDNLPASAHKSVNDHIDTSLTPQQRIAKVKSDPRYNDAKKAEIIAHIKANNHLN